MKNLIPDDFYLKQVQTKVVTHFYNRNKKHFHICILIDSCVYTFVWCTSSENLRNRIDKGIVDKNTVIFLKENIGFEITKPTMINCNEIDSFDESKLMSIIKNETFDFIGTVPDHLYVEILKAATISRSVPRDLKAKFNDIIAKI